MKATRKLIPALALLLVSAVLLSTASYAWFTTNTTVTATTSVSVTAPENLQISKAPEGAGNYSWVTAIDLKDIDPIRPASSVDGSNFYYLGTTATLDNIIDDTNYVLDEDTGNVYAATDTSKVSALGKATVVPTDDMGQYVYTDTLYLLSGNDVAKTDSEMELGLNVDISAGTDPGVSANLMNALRVAITIDGTTFIYAVGNAAGEKAITKVGEKFDTNALTTTVYDISATAASVLTGITLDAGSAKMVTVSIWYEGNVNDCVSKNVTIANEIEVVLSFVLVKKVASGT